MNTYKIVYRDTIYFTNADNMEEAEDKFYFFINDPEMESFRVWITEVNFVEEDAIVF